MTEYSLGVPIGQPNSTSNIVWVLQSDQPDRDWIFTRCSYWSAWQHIGYCLDAAVGSAGHWLNIELVYPSVSLTAHRILSACCSRISWTMTEYSLGCTHGSAWQNIQYCLGVAVGSAGHWLNIDSVYPSISLTTHRILSECCCRISRIVTEYSLGVSIGQPNSTSNIVCVLLSDQPDTDWIFTRCTHQ